MKVLIIIFLQSKTICKDILPRQIKKADEARILYHIIGTPTVENFKGLIKMNIIANNPITIEDVDRAEKIIDQVFIAWKEKQGKNQK